MEAAIRGALEKAGIPGAQARRRIYDSARGALDRSLERQGISDQAQITEHRHRLEVLIAGIEAEWTPPSETAGPELSAVERPAPDAAPPQARPASVDRVSVNPGRDTPRGTPEPAWAAPAWPEPNRPEGHPQDPNRRPPAAAPSIAPASRPEQRPAAAPHGEARLDIAADARDHTASTAVPVDAGFAAERSPHIPAQTGRPAKAPKAARTAKAPKARKEKRPRGVFAGMFSAAVMLSFLGIGIWWVVDSGLLQSAAERDTGVPNPPPSLSRDDYAGGPQQLNPGAGFSGDWTNVYTPGRDGAAEPRGDASADLIEQPKGNVLRIVSRTSGAGGEVLVPLGPEVMQALAGRKSVLALTVRTASPDATQIYVECDFSVLGKCGRHRFNVTYDTTDILFNLDYDRALAPNEGGNLVINSDISGGGKGIDLLAVRIKPLT